MQSKNETTPNVKKIAPVEQLSQDIVEEKIMKFIGNRSDLANLAKASIPMHALFQPRLSADRLLLAVAHCDIDPVMPLIKKNPNNILKKGDITDYSGRVFKNISPLQYAAWAYDTDTLKLLLAHCDQNMKLTASQQLAELEMNGTEHGAHFNFDPLLKALTDCVHNFNVWSDEQVENHWVKTIGGCQKMLPTHVAMIYCRTGVVWQDAFDLPTQFGMMKKTLNIYKLSASSEKMENWFPLTKDSGLGSTFAVCHLGLRGFAMEFVPVKKSVNNNLRAMTKLQDIKVKEYQTIQKTLLQDPADESHNQCCIVS